jgi:hypothetical protein
MTLGRGSGKECETGNDHLVTNGSNNANGVKPPTEDTTTSGPKPIGQYDGTFDLDDEEDWVSEEISEPMVMTFGRGSGKECDTGNDHLVTNGNGVKPPAEGTTTSAPPKTTPDNTSSSAQKAPENAKAGNGAGDGMSDEDDDDEDMDDSDMDEEDEEEMMERMEMMKKMKEKAGGSGPNQDDDEDEDEDDDEDEGMYRKISI